MIRAGSAVSVAVAALIALMVTACGSSAPDPVPDLFREYTKSTNVKNDKFGSGGTSEDRLANFAAYYTPEQLESALLSASPCDGGAECPLDGAVSKKAQDLVGSAGRVFERSILARHQDGSLELITLYVARRSDNTAELIDSTGKAYSGLDDFRRHNDLLSSDDLILTPRNITSVPGEGKIVTVSGHTPSNWRPWLIGGVVAVIVLGAGSLVTRRLVTRRHDPDVG